MFLFLFLKKNAIIYDRGSMKKRIVLLIIIFFLGISNVKAYISGCTVGGLYLNEESGTCSVCPSGYTSAAGSVGINSCYNKFSAGYYAHNNKNTICPSGSYCVGGKVYYGVEGKISMCPAAFPNSPEGAQNVNECYQEIESGKYAEKTNDVLQIKDCEEGYYCLESVIKYNEDVSDNKNNCPENFPNSQKSSSSLDDCYMPIPEGKYYEKKSDGSYVLEECPENSYCPENSMKYSENQKSNNIFSCPTVYSFSDKGSTKIEDCYAQTSDGEYINNNKIGTCPDGYVCEASNKVSYGSNSVIKLCPSGTFSKNGRECELCSDGMTTSSSGKNKCDIKCENYENVKEWLPSSFNDDKVANRCQIKSCIDGYHLENNKCEKDIIIPEEKSIITAVFINNQEIDLNNNSYSLKVDEEEAVIKVIMNDKDSNILINNNENTKCVDGECLLKINISEINKIEISDNTKNLTTFNINIIDDSLKEDISNEEKSEVNNKDIKEDSNTTKDNIPEKEAVNTGASISNYIFIVLIAGIIIIKVTNKKS